MKYIIIILMLVLVSCGETMTKEAFMSIKVEEKLDELRIKEQKKCEKAYWIKVNSIADSLLAVSAIGKTDSLSLERTKSRPKINYTPRYVDTLVLDPLFDENKKVKE